MQGRQHERGRGGVEEVSFASRILFALGCSLRRPSLAGGEVEPGGTRKGAPTGCRGPYLRRSACELVIACPFTAAPARRPCVRASVNEPDSDRKVKILMNRRNRVECAVAMAAQVSSSLHHTLAGLRQRHRRRAPFLYFPHLLPCPFPMSLTRMRPRSCLRLFPLLFFRRKLLTLCNCACQK